MPAFGALTFDRSAHFHLRRTTNGNGFVNIGILRGGGESHAPPRVLAAESLAAAATAFTGVHGHGWAMLSRNPCVT